MKNWENPEIKELEIKATYQDPCDGPYADEYDQGVYIQGYSESGPVYYITDWDH